MSATIKLLIADDHAIFRDGFKLLLRGQEQVVLVGEAENGEELVALCALHQPDVVITDIKMPVMDGIVACRKIRTHHPHTGIIALSMFNDDHLIVDMLEAGAHGYLLKNTTRVELLEAIETVRQGQPFYCEATSLKLTRLIAQSRYNPFQQATRPKLTPRETDVVRLICQQLTTKEIAGVLDLSIRTVESYKENIQKKLEVKNMVGIAIYAVKNGIYS